MSWLVCVLFCVSAQVCSNAQQMFKLGVGDRFVCDFDRLGFEELKRQLLEGPLI
jgi:hypothetical protein